MLASGLFLPATWDRTQGDGVSSSRSPWGRFPVPPSHSGIPSCRRVQQLVRRGRKFVQESRARSPPTSIAAPASRCVPSRLHPDAEEAELGAAQGGACASHQRTRGERLHPRRRAQPAGALGGADPRRSREGPARASATTSCAARSTPTGVSDRNQRPLEVRRQEAQVAHLTAAERASRDASLGRCLFRQPDAQRRGSCLEVAKRSVPSRPIPSTATAGRPLHEHHDDRREEEHRRADPLRLVRDHRERRRATTRWRCSAAPSRTFARASR